MYTFISTNNNVCLRLDKIHTNMTISNLRVIHFFLLLTFQYSFGQEVEVQWGEELKESKKSTLVDIIGHDESGFYALKEDLKGRNTLIVEHFNNEIVKTKSVELELKYNKKKLDFEFIREVGGEFYVFTTLLDNKSKVNTLFAQSIDKKTLNLRNDIKIIARNSYEGNSKRKSGDYLFGRSRDSSKVLIYYQINEKKNEFEQFGFHVFNNSMELLWEREISMPYAANLFAIEEFEITNQGNIFLLGYHKKDRSAAKRKGSPNYYYEIISYSNEGTEFDKYSIDVDNKFLTDMTIAINDKNNIICAGFYSDLGTFSLKGSFFMSINGNTKEKIVENYKEFGIDFITQNMSRKAEKKAKKKSAKGESVELYNYNLENIILRDDDGAILIGEQYFVDIRTYTIVDANGNRSTRTDYIYHYNDIIVISISPSGEIEWTEKIPKVQVTSNDHGFYSSYALTVTDDMLYFIYNDHAENLSPVADKERKVKNFTRGKNSVVTLARMDTDGRFVREALFKNKEVDIMTRPKVCEQISKKQMIVFGQRKKSQRFAKVTFNQ